MAGQNDIVDNRILDLYEYPEINSNNTNLIINQEDYGNYNIDEEIEEQGNRNREDENMNSEDENDNLNDDDEDMFKYLGVKALKLNVNVNDPDVDPNTVHRCFNDIPEVDRDKLSISVSILPNLKPKENINDPDVRYSSMREAVVDLERRIIKISPDDIQYYGPGTGIEESKYKNIELNYPNLYIGFSKLMLYLENLYDARKLVKDVIYPPQYTLENKIYKAGIIPYNNSVNNENKIVILPPQGYDYMDKVITSLNLREINLPYKILELVYGQYYKYNYNISEVVEIEEDGKFIPNTGIKNFDFNLRKIVADSRTVDGETRKLKLSEEDKNGFDYNFNNIQMHMNPVIGFADDILIDIEERNYYNEIDLTSNNDKVRVHKLPRVPQQEPVPENNNKRIRTIRGDEDPIESQYGITNYDVIKKVYNNYHLYTIDKENSYRDDLDPGSENYSLGFKSVMQTTEIPIIDNVRLDEVKSNGLLTYNIDDFNDSYSLEAGSKNPYANDFIGFNQIQIPIKINNKVIPGFGSTPNIYRPSDFDPDAIGFSSFQIESTRDGGGSIVNVNNLVNYEITSNSSLDENDQLIPYSIANYNSEHNTNYTGFDNIIVNVPQTVTKKITYYNIDNFYYTTANSQSEWYDNNTKIVSPNDFYQVSDSDVTKLQFYLLPQLSFAAKSYCIFLNNHGSDKIICGFIRINDSNRTLVNEGYWANFQRTNNDIYFNIYYKIGDNSYIPLFCNRIFAEGPNIYDKYIIYNSQIGEDPGNDGENYNVNNLIGYTFKENNIIPYTIEMYNNNQNPITNYTGFDYINVNVKNKLITANIELNNIENVTKNYLPYDVVNSFIPVMSSNNSNGARIVSQVNSHSEHNAWMLFDNNNGTYYELTSGSLNASFVLALNEEYVIRSIFYLFTSGNQGVGKLKVYGSFDGEEFVEIYNKQDVNNAALNYANSKNYIYDNVENDVAYSYYKVETERTTTNSYLQFWTLKFFEEEKVYGFDKFTVINNTYSKTANPVCSSYNTSNQTVNVQTSDTTLYPYVRRGNMTVPLEDKIINIDGNYVPGSISVSSGYYGIKSVKFISNNETSVCTSLIESQSDNSNQVNNNKMVIGDYTITCTNSINDGSVFWKLFDYSNWNQNSGYAWVNSDSSSIKIEKTYPFIINCIIYRKRYLRTANVYLYGTIDGVNWIRIFSMLGYNESDYVYDSNHVKLQFNNNLKYLKYKFWVDVSTNDWNLMEKIMFDYCNDSTIDERSVTYPIMNINLDQPGTYYYDPPIGYNNIGSVIVSYSTGDPVVVTENIVNDGTYTILPPSGKSSINRVDLNVQCVRNEDVNIYNTITESGYYEIPSGYTGFNSFYVDVEPKRSVPGLSIDRFYNVNQNATKLVSSMSVLNNDGNSNPSFRVTVDPGYSVCKCSFWVFDDEIKLSCIEFNNQSSSTYDQQWYVNFYVSSIKESKKYYYGMFTQYQDTNLESHIQALYGSTVKCDIILNDFVINDSNFNSSKGLSPTHIIVNDQNQQQLKFINVNRDDIDIPYLNIKYFNGYSYTKYVYDRLSSGPYKFGQNGDEGWSIRTNYWCYYIDEVNCKILYRHTFFNVYLWERTDLGQLPYFEVPVGWKYGRSANDNPGYNVQSNVFDNLNNQLTKINTGNSPDGYDYGEIDINNKYVYRLVNDKYEWVFYQLSNN